MKAMECELCGRTASLTKTEIEGTVLAVCSSCAALGRNAEPKITDIPKKKMIEPVESVINPDFASTVKAARSRVGLSLEDLGRKINEKASVLDWVERCMRPTDELARKLEKSLKIRLLGFQE